MTYVWCHGTVNSVLKTVFVFCGLFGGFLFVGEG